MYNYIIIKDIKIRRIFTTFIASFVCTLILLFVNTKSLLTFFMTLLPLLAMGVVFVIFAIKTRDDVDSELQVVKKELEKMDELVKQTETLAKLDVVCSEMTKSLTAITIFFQKMSSRDFTNKLDGEFSGEVKSLQNAVNSVIDILNKTLLELKGIAGLLDKGAKNVAIISNRLHSWTAEQVNSLGEIGESMVKVDEQINQNANSTKEAQTLSVDLKNCAHLGSEKMKSVLNANKNMSDASKNIHRITKVIDEIAFQTNLLALNASIEAVQAGKYGKGFAVVAMEVKGLANRSSCAAKEIVLLVDDLKKKTEEGVSTTNGAALVLEEMVNKISKITDSVVQISSASNEQAEAVSRANLNIKNIHETIQKTANAAKDLATNAENLTNRSQNLTELIASFKLSGEKKKDDETDADQKKASESDDVVWM
ncbi:MAG: hypothetical protein HQK49_11000 [Oligoflexia bacterium]|nr:hypothetical protein [Oligoflexia bacterium]